MNAKNFIIGIVLIVLGLLFLADNLDWIYLSWDNLWPFLMVIAGALFWLGWLTHRKEYGLLMPGTILIVYGLLFWFCAVNGWWYMGAYHLWAFFIIGPGLGFLALYIFGEREKGMLVPAGILIGLGIIFLSGSHFWRFIVPVGLILIGVVLLWRSRRSISKSSSDLHSDSTSSSQE